MEFSLRIWAKVDEGDALISISSPPLRTKLYFYLGSSGLDGTSLGCSILWRDSFGGDSILWDSFGGDSILWLLESIYISWGTSKLFSEIIILICLIRPRGQPNLFQASSKSKMS